MTALGVDTGACLINYRNRISYVSKGKETVLFKSEIPLLNFAVALNGKMYISTPAGVMEVSKDLSLKRLSLDISDGMVRTENKTLFILSNKKQKIYLVDL